MKNPQTTELNLQTNSTPVKNTTNSSSNASPDQAKKKKRKIILMSTLIPVGSLVVATGICLGIMQCAGKEAASSVILSDNVKALGITVSSFNVTKGKDSTITFKLPDGKYVDKMQLKIGDATYSFALDDFDTETHSILSIPASMVIDSTITVDSAELQTISYFEPVAYESGHIGETMVAGSSFAKGFKGKLTIPAKILVGGEEKTITGIASGGFKDCGTITEYAFENISQITTIEESAFQENTSLTSFTIPSGVTIIKDNLFTNCKALKTVTLHDNIAAIEDSAFAGTIIESIVLPKNLTKIDKFAFDGCTKLTSVEFGDTSKTWIQSGGSAITITDKTANATNLVNCEKDKSNNWGYTGIEVQPESAPFDIKFVGSDKTFTTTLAVGTYLENYCWIDNDLFSVTGEPSSTEFENITVSVSKWEKVSVTGEEIKIKLDSTSHYIAYDDSTKKMSLGLGLDGASTVTPKDGDTYTGSFKLTYKTTTETKTWSFDDYTFKIVFDKAIPLTTNFYDVNDFVSSEGILQINGFNSNVKADPTLLSNYDTYRFGNTGVYSAATSIRIRPDQQTPAFGETGSDYANLKTLVFNNDENCAVDAISYAFRNNTVIETIDFGKNSVQFDGSTFMIDDSSNANLRKIILSPASILKIGGAVSTESPFYNQTNLATIDVSRFTTEKEITDAVWSNGSGNKIFQSNARASSGTIIISSESLKTAWTTKFADVGLDVDGTNWKFEVKA